MKSINYDINEIECHEMLFFDYSQEQQPSGASAGSQFESQVTTVITYISKS